VAVAFNCNETKIAVGANYTWDEGEKALKANAISPWLGVRKVGGDVEVCSAVAYPPFPPPFRSCS